MIILTINKNMDFKKEAKNIVFLLREFTMCYLTLSSFIINTFLVERVSAGIGLNEKGEN